MDFAVAKLEVGQINFLHFKATYSFNAVIEATPHTL